LESHRHGAILVGEDLGTVPPEVPLSMACHNFHRLYVVEYEVKPDAGAALPDPPAVSLASINTHDMAPFAGFLQGTDLEERREAGLLQPERFDDEAAVRETLRSSLQSYLEARGLIAPDAGGEELLTGCLAHLRDSPCRMLLVNLEDLWHETRSQNIPSTAGDNPNWRRKARLAFEEFKSDPRILKLIAEVNKGFGAAESTAAREPKTRRDQP
jgi:4-alpha-glucanotransferase